MPRRIQPETEAVNADSFLDIVAGVVSIMIIMVLMTGLKIKHTPIDAPLQGEAAEVSADLMRDAQTEQTLHGDVFRVAAEIQQVQQETLLRKHQRDVLALAVASQQQTLQGTRQAIDVQANQDTALAGQLSEAAARLEQLDRQRVAIETAPATPVQIECYPTPISHTVDGHELHFQLRAGRIEIVPLDSLIEKLKADAQHKIYKLRDLPEMTEIVGPEGGFRLRYTIERVDISPEGTGAKARGGSYAQLKRWTLIPVSDDLGETVDEALAAGSQFRQALADRRAKGATVTIWTYPDSFDAFRRVKKELYGLGFPVAARPLPEGAPISGSPEGSKSAAE
jgi:hypothetical protein